MPRAKTPLVRGDKLTERGRAKLQGQMKKARQIMEAETKDKREGSKTYAEAKRMYERALKILHKPAKKASPGQTKKKTTMSTGARGVAELVKRAARAHKKTQTGLSEVQRTAGESGGGPKGSVRKEDYDRITGKG